MATNTHHIIACMTLCLIMSINCQRGLFYGQKALGGEQNKPIQFKDLINTDPDSRKSILVNLKTPIYFFGESDARDGRVHAVRTFEDGLITIGRDMERPGCPKLPKNNRFSLIAPFWMQYTSGRVTIQQLPDINSLGSPEEAVRMITEINNAFKGDITSNNDVKGILIVTWRNMKNRDNIHRGELKNTFQLAIITTNTASYAIFIYRLLDISYAKKNNGDAAKCFTEHAVIGVGSSSKEGLDISRFFQKEYREWVAYFSNINDFTNLGRYVIKLESGVKQPLPPIADCSKTNKDPTVCIRTSWFAIQQRVSEDFCRYRSAGIYQYPFTCDQFVSCGVGAKSFSLSLCANGTGFNPALGICDHKGNFECRFPQRAFIITGDKKMKGHTTPSIQPIVHENFCFLRGNGFYRDPNRCNYYFVCNSGRGNVLKCPNGLFWQITGNGKGKCNFRGAVICIRPTTTTTTRRPLHFCEKNGVGRYPNPNDCQLFLVCTHTQRRKKIIMKCPGNLVFKPTSHGNGYCDYKPCCRNGDRSECCRKCFK